MLLLLAGCFGNDPYDRHIESQLNQYLSQFDDHSTYIEDSVTHDLTYQDDEYGYTIIDTAVHMAFGAVTEFSTKDLNGDILTRFNELYDDLFSDDAYVIVDNSEAEYEIDYCVISGKKDGSKWVLTASYGINAYFEPDDDEGY